MISMFCLIVIFYYAIYYITAKGSNLSKFIVSVAATIFSLLMLKLYATEGLLYILIFSFALIVNCLFSIKDFNKLFPTKDK